MPTFALIDGNTFYASCEKLFHPELADRPVVVLSNNDGCVVTRSQQAKALGIKRGTPYFEIADRLKAHNAAVFSSNYTLYQSLSNRMMSAIAALVPRIEVYSIDECFADLSRVDGNLTEKGQQIRAHLLKSVGMPTCVGIGPTKTLAKLCNHLAKDIPGLKGVLDWGSLTVKRQQGALAWAKVSDVWGIGPSMTAQLNAMGVNSVWDFMQLDAGLVKTRFGIVGLRVWQELHGKVCYPFDQTPPVRQEICRSRSFAKPVTTVEGLIAALTTHTDEAARRLRAQKGAAGAVTVFFHTSRFKQGPRTHIVSETVPLSVATDDTLTLTDVVVKTVKARFRNGCDYKKAGIVLGRIEPLAQTLRPQSLFEDPGALEKRERRHRLMTTVDNIVRRHGRGVLMAAPGVLDDQWQMRRDHLSGEFTTDILDVPLAL